MLLAPEKQRRSAVVLDTGEKHLIPMASSREARKATSPRTPYFRNQSQRSRLFPPADRAKGHSGRVTIQQTSSRGFTVSRWARHPTLRCLEAGRTSRNCHVQHTISKELKPIGADGKDLNGGCHQRGEDLPTNHQSSLHSRHSRP